MAIVDVTIAETIAPWIDRVKYVVIYDSTLMYVVKQLSMAIKVKSLVKLTINWLFDILQFCYVDLQN